MLVSKALGSLVKSRGFKMLGLGLKHAVLAGLGFIS